MQQTDTDQCDARPCVDQVPGVACEKDVGVRYAVRAARKKEQVDTCERRHQSDNPNSCIDGSVEPAAVVKVFVTSQQVVEDASGHAGDPMPVNGDVDSSDNDDGDAAPDMQVLPGGACEQDRDAVHRVATALVTDHRQEQKVDAG